MDWKDALSKLQVPQAPEEPETTAPEASDGYPKDTLHVLIDRSHRKGKTATIVEGFTGTDQQLTEIAAILKKRLGTGGSARGGEILIQGDCLAKVKEILHQLGFKTKG